MILESIFAVIVAVYLRMGVNSYNYSAIFYGLIAYVLFTYADAKKKQRLGLPVPGTSRVVLELTAAFLILLMTLVILTGIDYALLLAPPVTGSTVLNMLNDLITFDGVLMGFTSVIVGLDLNDLVKENAPPKSPYRRYLTRRRNWGLLTLLMLTIGTFASLLSIPWAEVTPTILYLLTPIQATVFGIGMLLAGMVGYRQPLSEVTLGAVSTEP